MQRDERSESVNRALGGFLLFFGVVVLLAAFFTQGIAGQLTNAAAGLIIGGIGGGMIWRVKGGGPDHE